MKTCNMLFIIISIFILSSCAYENTVVKSNPILRSKYRPNMNGTSNIVGQAFDKNDDVPIQGVNVVLQGTKYGGVTDSLGNYSIQNIIPGTYTIKALYIGYKEAVYENLIVQSDDYIILDFSLADTLIEIH